MSAVEWQERGPDELGLGESVHGGPHAGPLDARQRRVYRFTFALLLWTEWMVFVTLWALRVVYAGTEDLGRPLWPPVVLLLLLAAGALPLRAALAAARSADARRCARLLLAALAPGVLVLAGIGWEWAALGLPASSHLGELYYATAGTFAVLLAAQLLAAVAAAAAWRRGRGSEFAADAAWLHWLLLAAAWLGILVVVYAL